MKTYYKCSNCGQFYEEKDIERITYSCNELNSYLCVWIYCNVCKKKAKEEKQDENS